MLTNSLIHLLHEPGKNKTAKPVKVQLKDPNRFPSCKQYCMKPEAREGLLSIVKEFLKFGLLKPCHSPCNTPKVLKPNRKYWMAQDLKIINEVIIPIHPLMDDSYSLFSLIPGDTKWYTVLDLEDISKALSRDIRNLGILVTHCPCENKKHPWDKT